MSRLAISSWSLHALLTSGFPLLDLPQHMQQHGFSTLELCHFHLPTTDAAYLKTFRQAMQTAGVELYSLLIDTGDITAPDPAQRTADTQMIQGWIDAAASLGAERVRIDAGRQPPSPEVIERSATQLRALAWYAAHYGLRTSTENWHITAQEADDVCAILDLCGGAVDLCADFGNAEATADKYATVGQLLPRATSIHFSTRYTADGSTDAEDLRRSRDLLAQYPVPGVTTLIYGKKSHEWAGIEQLRQALQPQAV